MRRGRTRRCVLTVAGSDSGGGAGIQADLKTFAALGLHGTTVITCLTAQNPDRVTGIQAASRTLVRRQLEAVFDGFAPRAVKTGMLFSAAIIGEVVAFIDRAGGAFPPLVVDPVMVATSGAVLLERPAIRAVRERLLPRALLATPNLAEVRHLTGIEVRGEEDMVRAARVFRDRFGCSVLVKGGHLSGREAVDLFWDGRRERWLRTLRVRVRSSHGTGCTLSAAIAGYLALGRSLPSAIEAAKDLMTEALRLASRVDGHSVLAPSAGR